MIENCLQAVECCKDELLEIKEIIAEETQNGNMDRVAQYKDLQKKIEGELEEFQAELKRLKESYARAGITYPEN